MKNNISNKNIEKESINNVFNVFNEKEQGQQIINNNNSISSNSIYTDDSTSEIKFCDTPFIYHKEKYLVDRDKNKIISLYSTFKCLKEKFGLKNTRKNRIDCIIKKVKTKYIKSIHEAIKYCVNLYIKRLPQFFITNIKIEYNKMYLNKTIEQIYTEFKILPSLNELREKNLIKKGKKESLTVLMNSTLKDIYQYYLNSQLYKYNRMYIKNKEGEKVAKLYDYIAQNICQYFLYNKGNKKKNINNINNNKININNINNNNIKNIKSNLYDKKFFNGKEIIVQNNVNNNLLKYSCNNNIKNNNNLYSLGEDKLYINKIKFTVLKTE
jgi:hypothetical protein